MNFGSGPLFLAWFTLLVAVVGGIFKLGRMLEKILTVLEKHDERLKAHDKHLEELAALSLRVLHLEVRLTPELFAAVGRADNHAGASTTV